MDTNSPQIILPNYLAFMIQNNHNATQTVRLFDSEFYNEHIQIDSAIEGITHSQHLADFLKNNNSINKVRVMLTNGTLSMINPFRYSIVVGNTSFPSVISINPLQFQNNIVEGEVDFKIKDGVKFEFKLPAYTGVYISFNHSVKDNLIATKIIRKGKPGCYLEGEIRLEKTGEIPEYSTVTLNDYICAKPEMLVKIKAYYQNLLLFESPAIKLEQIKVQTIYAEDIVTKVFNYLLYCDQDAEKEKFESQIKEIGYSIK